MKKSKSESRSSKSKTYSIYPGCLIPSRYPSIEISSRKVLDKLGIELVDLKNTTCCPNQMAIKSSDEDTWELLAARNLAIAESVGYDILSLCNGCYNTLKSVNSALKNNEKLRSKINKELKALDLEFKGKIKVKHILEVLSDDIGVTIIERALVKSLDGLIAATHTGCHVTRPEDNVPFDDTKNPKKLDKLVELLGIENVDFPEKHICCGGGLKIASTEDAVSYARKKFNHIKKTNANCMVVVCPYCRAQFESALDEIKECYNEKIDLPIFYYTELLGLAMGFVPNQLGLFIADPYMESKKQLLKSITSSIDSEDLFDDVVTKEQLKICYECQACVDDCSSASVSDYHPNELLELALAGKFDELINKKDIWYCMNCHECMDNCPQGFGMVKFIFKLKNLAIDRGICPDVITHRDIELSESGYAFKPNTELRKKLGLPEIKGAGKKDIMRLISGTCIEKTKKECEDK